MPKSSQNTQVATRTVAYDVAEQLRTPEEMAAYLDAWLTEAPDDVSGIARALGDIARAKGMAQVAKEYQLDLLHVHYAVPHAIAAVLAKQMVGDHLKVVTTLHGTDITGLGEDPSWRDGIRFGIQNS